MDAELLLQLLARSLLNAVRSVKFSTYFTTYKQEPERPAAECDESGGVFGLEED
jgi:hypothetical protein